MNIWPAKTPTNPNKTPLTVTLLFSSSLVFTFSSVWLITYLFCSLYSPDDFCVTVLYLLKLIARARFFLKYCFILEVD